MSSSGKGSEPNFLGFGYATPFQVRVRGMKGRSFALPVKPVGNPGENYGKTPSNGKDSQGEAEKEVGGGFGKETDRGH